MFGKGFGSLDGKEDTSLIRQGKMTRGKYAGETVEWVLANKPSYIMFLWEHATNHGVTAVMYKTAQLSQEQLDEDKSERRNSNYSCDEFWGDK